MPYILTLIAITIATINFKVAFLFNNKRMLFSLKT